MLYVPGIVASVLSVGQMNKCGYVVKMGPKLITIRDRATGTLFGEAWWNEKRGFFMRFKVV